MLFNFSFWDTYNFSLSS